MIINFVGKWSKSLLSADTGLNIAIKNSDFMGVCLPDLPSYSNEVHDWLPLRTPGHKARLSILWETYLSCHNAGRFPHVTTSGQNVGYRPKLARNILMRWTGYPFGTFG